MTHIALNNTPHASHLVLLNALRTPGGHFFLAWCYDRI